MLRPRVLIVDDDREYAQLFARRQCLRRPELDVDVITSPREALELLHAYELVIVDASMPELDGRAFLDEARRRGVDGCRVVINSSYEAETLHGVFGLGECLAVLNKLDRAQQAVLDMILDQIASGRRARRRN